jgi:hypothetical protein
MKKSLLSFAGLIFLFCIHCAVLQAQSWSPLKVSEKFNFNINGINFITNTIWTDSVKIVAGDSVFYLNRIVTACDTCPAYFRLSNQPGFLKSRMIRKPGGIYIFTDPGSVMIKTFAHTGDTWLYDSAGNITAHVISATLEPVFGTNDSVKEILLSSGYSLRLSKNFGLLQFPTSGPGSFMYFLEGIEGRDIGQLVPKFTEIYNYNPGDVFQYHSYYMQYGIGTGAEALEKIKILEKDSTLGRYSYNILRISCNWPVNLIGMHGDTTHFYSFDTLVFNDSLTHLANYYPDQIVENPLGNNFGPNTSYFRSTLDVDQVYTKWIGSFTGGDDPAIYVHGSYLTPPLAWDVLAPGAVQSYLNIFKPGLGNTYYMFSFFEVSEEEELIGYIKNGDTTGYIYPDNLILQGVHGEYAGRGYKVYPNPAGEFLRVKGAITGENAEVEIRNISGALVKKIPYAATIAVSDLIPGFYFITIIESGHGKSWNGRFIKN